MTDTTRADAVNLARQFIDHGCRPSQSGIGTLCRGIIAMDAELAAARSDAQSWSDQCAERVKDWDAMRERAELAESMTANTLRDAFNDREELAALRTRIAELKAALIELVTLKDMHDKIECADNSISDERYRLLDAGYRQRKPIAWQRARNLIDAARKESNQAGEGRVK